MKGNLSLSQKAKHYCPLLLIVSSQPTSLLASTPVIRCNKVPAQYKGQINYFILRIPVHLHGKNSHLTQAVVCSATKYKGNLSQNKVIGPTKKSLSLDLISLHLKIPIIPKTYFNSVEIMRVRGIIIISITQLVD